MVRRELFGQGSDWWNVFGSVTCALPAFSSCLIRNKLRVTPGFVHEFQHLFVINKISGPTLEITVAIYIYSKAQ